MTEKEINKIVKKLRESSFSGYYIAKKTGITEQSILNYKNGTTIPTNANAKLLEYFFKDEKSTGGINQSIIGNKNQMIGGDNNIITDNGCNDNDTINELKVQIEKKDNLIAKLMQQNETLLEQISKLIK